MNEMSLARAGEERCRWREQKGKKKALSRARVKSKSSEGRQIGLAEREEMANGGGGSER